MTFRRNHVDELISASLAGDLSDAERAELDAHLARCETCRATLVAFTAERRILSGMPVADPPRDLAARVRTGIDSGRLRGPWWRRPGGLIAIGASVATVAAAVLAIVVFGNFQFGPVGQPSGSPSPAASSSFGPAPSAMETSPASAAPTDAAAFALAPGELGYLSLTGAPFEAPRLSFINDATGDSIDAGPVSGQPLAAVLSPDGQWLAYITQKGETGANEVWALNLNDSEALLLACSSAAPFTNRLTWSPAGDLLAFTVAAVDLGPTSGCPEPSGTAGLARVWLFSAADRAAAPLMEAGDSSFAASFVPFRVPGAANRLWVSHAGELPRSELLAVGWPAVAVETLAEADGVFLPRLSPDGSRAIFWSGTLTSNGGSWHFSVGGMPQLSGDFRSAGPASPWLGTPLFTDLVPVGGEAFASGDFAWGDDSDQLAFWNGAWTGAPQSADGTYPNQWDVYVGQVSGALLSAASRLALDVADGSWIVDVAISASAEVAVTIGLPSAGIGDPPSAYLQVVPLDGGSPHAVGGGSVEPPWNGPAVYGY